MKNVISSAVSQLQKIEELTQAYSQDNVLLRDVFLSIGEEIAKVRTYLAQSMAASSAPIASTNMENSTGSDITVTSSNMRRKWIDLLEHPAPGKTRVIPLSFQTTQLDAVETMLKGSMHSWAVERPPLAMLLELSRNPKHELPADVLAARIGYKTSTVTTNISRLRHLMLRDSNWMIGIKRKHVQLEEHPSVETNLLKAMNQDARAMINVAVKAYWARQGYSTEGDPEKILGSSIWKLYAWVVQRVDQGLTRIDPRDSEMQKVLESYESWRSFIRNVFESADDEERGGCIRITKNW